MIPLLAIVVVPENGIGEWSVASITLSTFLAAALSSSRIFSLPSMTAYVSVKSFAKSTAFGPLGRSFRWPFEARTSNPAPRYFFGSASCFLTTFSKNFFREAGLFCRAVI